MKSITSAFVVDVECPTNALQDEDFRMLAEYVDQTPIICCAPFTPQYGVTGSLSWFQPGAYYAFYLVFDDGHEGWYAYHEILVPTYKQKTPSL